MRAEPKEYEIYRHFKGSFYQIVAVAVHTETKEKMVIYRALKNSAHVFARPLSMFMSEVDRDKYPDIDIQYRFTKIEGEEVNIKLGEDLVNDKPAEENVLVNETKSAKESEQTNEAESAKESEQTNETESAKESEQTNENDFDTCKYKEDGTLVIDPLVEQILDQKDFTKKIEVFQLLRNKCTQEMLTQIAISLDIKLTSDTIDGNYAEIMKVLRMHEKYESGRLR